MRARTIKGLSTKGAAILLLSVLLQPMIVYSAEPEKNSRDICEFKATYADILNEQLKKIVPVSRSDFERSLAFNFSSTTVTQLHPIVQEYITSVFMNPPNQIVLGHWTELLCPADANGNRNYWLIMAIMDANEIVHIAQTAVIYLDRDFFARNEIVSAKHLAFEPLVIALQDAILKNKMTKSEIDAMMIDGGFEKKDLGKVGDGTCYLNSRSKEGSLFWEKSLYFIGKILTVISGDQLKAWVCVLPKGEGGLSVEARQF